MAIMITSPKTGSLKVTNSSASPQSNYLCNMATDSIVGAPFEQSVAVQNSNGQIMQSFPISKITSIGGIAFSGSLQDAVDQIAGLLMSASTPITNGFSYTFDFALA